MNALSPLKVETLSEISLSENKFLSDATLQLVREHVASEGEPLLTVLVVAYRHENYIDECLESISCTSMQLIELIIIDDGSPDSTLQKCLDFKFQSSVNVYIYTKVNKGLVHSLFYGLKLARGRYISIMASDDSYASQGLDKVIKKLQEDLNIDALLCQAEFMGAIEGKVYDRNMDVFFGLTPLERLERIWSEPPAPMLLQATVFNTTFLRGMHPWADNLILDDWPTFIRLFVAEAMFCAKVEYFPHLTLSKYRMHEGGTHANLDRHLRVITQTSYAIVPNNYRHLALANTHVDIGLSYCRNGRLLKGGYLLVRALYGKALIYSVARVSCRVKSFFVKRLR